MKLRSFRPVSTARVPIPAFALGLALALTFALALAPVRTACADLLLNEVLYDPEGADEGREFIELWNPDSTALPLEGVVLEACDGARPGSWTTLWRGAAGTTAVPRTAHVIHGAALAAALQNGPDAIRLVRGGTVLDLLGYGDLEDASLREGEPAVDAPSGQSLGRIRDGVDTGSNRADWEAESDPTPGEANHPDRRLRFTRAGARTVPEVAWPGETVEARAWVRNSGTRTVEAARWLVEADLSSGDGPIPLGSATARGAAVAAGESILVSLALSTPAPGLWAARLRLAGVPPGVEVADTTTAMLRSGTGAAIVTEFAYRDAGAGEWIEIWFRDAVEDLALLSIADDASVPRAVDRGAVPKPVARGTFLVLAQDPAAVRARYALAESLVLGLSGGWPSLNDGAISGAVADRVRVLVSAHPSDAVPYTEGRSARGGSVERLSADLPSASPGSWAETIHPEGGTPGGANSVRAPERGETRGRGLLVAGARVFRARDGGTPALFRVTEEALGRRLTVRVHDLLGRPLRTLVDGQRFDTDAAFAWDGRNERGEAVVPGLYVVRAEALRDETGGPLVSSILLAVAAGGER